jgi:hypothetical protein
VTRTIDGTLSGETFHEEWRPGRDIDGHYSCDVTYGFAAGLAPAQKVVMLLQLRADGDIDRDTLRRQLPWDIDVEQMQRSMDVQAVRDAAVASVQGLLGMAGQMAANGMDPTPILTGATNFIKGRQDGQGRRGSPRRAVPGARPAAGAGAGHDGSGRSRGRGPPGGAPPGTAEPAAARPARRSRRPRPDRGHARRAGRPCPRRCVAAPSPRKRAETPAHPTSRVPALQSGRRAEAPAMAARRREPPAAA